MIARLKEGVSIQAAAAEIEAIFEQLDEVNYSADPTLNRGPFAAVVQAMSSIRRRSEIVSMKEGVFRRICG